MLNIKAQIDDLTGSIQGSSNVVIQWIAIGFI